MSKKQIVLFAFVVILCISPLLYYLMGAWWFHDMRQVEEELIKTESGDHEYIFRFITSISHHAQIEIIDASNKRQIANFFIGLPAKPPVKVLIDSPELRCYDVSNSSIIYQVNNKFDGIKKSDVKYCDPAKKPDLVIVAKALTAQKQWNWLQVFGEFLIKVNDKETIYLLERYAQGQFKSEELEAIKNSGITATVMQDISKQILSKRQNK